VELDVSTLHPDQRVQPVTLAPGEPPPQLEGVQGADRPDYRANNDTAAT
jgi:hypothetical protein